MSNNKLEGHEYDGIRELDNPLPSWWLWTFFITIIFGAIYFIHYEFGGGPTLTQELEVAMTELDKAKVSAPKIMETEESLAAAMAGEDILKLGSAQYAAKCSACHGAELQGLIGPNLTDKNWIHGKGTRTDIVNLVRIGVADKGMPPWGPVMKKEEIYAVSAFILSKKGTSPSGAKAPQGDIVETY